MTRLMGGLCLTHDSCGCVVGSSCCLNCPLEACIYETKRSVPRVAYSILNEVQDLVNRGWSGNQISWKMGISIRTVRRYTKYVKELAGVSNG